MKKEAETLVDSDYMPDQFDGKAVVQEAYVAKAGYLRLELNEDLSRGFFSRDSKPPTMDFLQELFGLLSKSPHVMEVSPKQEDLLKGELAFTLWPCVVASDGSPRVSSLSLSEFIKMRVMISKHKQDKLFKLSAWSRSPEQFTLYFNGAIFLACFPVKLVPFPTHVGQVAREFLAETLAESKLWARTEGIGPTPIHPEIYILSVAPIGDQLSLAESRAPAVKTVRGDLVVAVPAITPVERVLQYLLEDMSWGLEGFYGVRIVRHALDDRIAFLHTLNQRLGQALAEHLRLNPISRLLSKSAGEIRRLLGDMHLALQGIAALELEAQNREEETTRSLQRGAILVGLDEYFKEHMLPSSIPDQNSQLRFMDFAADETENSAIVQATLVSALIGAIIGGLIAALGQ